jgi:hypothetical protein
MAVVKGLVTAGIFSHTFHASKKARRGYYIPIPEVYVPNLHPSQYIFVGLDGLSYCQNSITTIINKGQVLGPDEFFRIKITKLIIPGDATPCGQAMTKCLLVRKYIATAILVLCLPGGFTCTPKQESSVRCLLLRN